MHLALQLMKGLLKIFITYSSLLVGPSMKKKYFQDESMTAQFLNKIVMTAACLFDAVGQHHMKPLCYFSAINSNIPICEAALDRKPDIVLLCLVSGNYTRVDHINWKDVQALIEHTTSKELPKCMALTITDKNYLMFCAQPERNFYSQSMYHPSQYRNFWPCQPDRNRLGIFWSALHRPLIPSNGNGICFPSWQVAGPRSHHNPSSTWPETVWSYF